NWFISGEENPACWDDDQLNDLKGIPGTAFEVIVSPPPPSDVAGDLMRNGGFEAGLPGGKKPSFWTLNTHNDTRRCDSESVTVSHSGRGAFEFRGTAAGYTDSIQQVVNLNGISFTSVTFDGYAASFGAASDS